MNEIICKDKRVIAMKKRIPCLLIICLLMGALTGCGEKNDTSGKETVSGGAVSGGAVSGSAAEEKRVEGYQFPIYHTDANWYDWDEGEDIICRRVDGKHEKTINIKGLDQVLSVVDGYLYYTTCSAMGAEDGQDCIYRVPLEKDKDGYDKIIKEKAELLVEETCEDDEKGIRDGYVDFNCIFYTTYEGGIVQYDLATKKKKAVEEPVSGFEAHYCYIFGDGNHIYMEIDSEGMFSWEKKAEKWVKLIGPDVSESMNAWSGDAYYHCLYWENEPDVIQDIYQIDLEKKTEKVFVTRQQIRQAAKEAEGLREEKELDFSCVTDLFCHEDRLYIQIQMNWTKNNQYQIGYALFSQGKGEDKLRYEKDLTQCMRTWGGAQKGKLKADNYSVIESRTVKEEKEKIMKEPVWFYDTGAFELVNGKVFICQGDSGSMDVQRIGCYDISTGEFRQLTEKKSEFWEPCAYGTAEDEDEYELSHEMQAPDNMKEQELPYITFVEG